MANSTSNIQNTEDLRAVLLRMGLITSESHWSARELSGGVSNTVMLVQVEGASQPLIVKQALPQLKVKEEWLCDVGRVWREVEVLRTCSELLSKPLTATANRSATIVAETPRLLGEDRPTHCYAMTAAPVPHSTWKQEMLAGKVSIETAQACGVLLARLHGGSWHQPALATALEDRQYFDSLRLDPYYRFMARSKHVDLAPSLTSLVDECWSQRHCLVHGDFSPKNLLVAGQALWLIDFEVGHYGDPAFDLGFFGTHLVLKTLWSGARHTEYAQLVHTFWNAYVATLQSMCEAGAGPTAEELAAVGKRASRHLVSCCLARVDGKSPVDYLSPAQQQTVREVMVPLVAAPAEPWEDRVARVLALLTR